MYTNEKRSCSKSHEMQPNGKVYHPGINGNNDADNLCPDKLVHEYNLK